MKKLILESDCSDGSDEDGTLGNCPLAEGENEETSQKCCKVMNLNDEYYRFNNKFFQKLKSLIKNHFTQC